MGNATPTQVSSPAIMMMLMMLLEAKVKMIRGAVGDGNGDGGPCWQKGQKKRVESWAEWHSLLQFHFDGGCINIDNDNENVFHSVL